VQFVQRDLRRDDDSAPDGRLDVYERYLDLEELHGHFSEDGICPFAVVENKSLA